MTGVSWAEFELAEPALAAQGRARLHGRVCYLATIRPDSSPRVHPVTPIVAQDALYVFMEPTSPKGHDLRRDGRYALHAGVEDNEGGGGEFLVSGAARFVESPVERSLAAAASSYPPRDRYILFALGVSEAQATRYRPAPDRTSWRPPQSP